MSVCRLVELDHEDRDMAARIGTLMRASYRVEGALLERDDFPPAHRTDAAVRSSPARFFGLFIPADSGSEQLVAVAEVELEATCIASFTVHADQLRRGFGRELLAGLLKRFEGEDVRVATARANRPAIALYESAGFAVEQRWATECEIAMVTLVRKRRQP